MTIGESWSLYEFWILFGTFFTQMNRKQSPDPTSVKEVQLLIPKQGNTIQPGKEAYQRAPGDQGFTWGSAGLSLKTYVHIDVPKLKVEIWRSTILQNV